jgi:outer membrane lipoprotein-sorting protein
MNKQFRALTFPRVGALALLLLLLLSNQAVLGQAKENSETLLHRWIDKQAQLKTWEAQFVQTRSLVALKDPLISTGRVWFAAPSQFRWELGTPPQTIAIREGDDLWVVYPRLKRAEKYSLGNAKGPWKDALALLEGGFPRNRNELESRFRIQSVERTAEGMQASLEPRSAEARKFVPRFNITFAPDSLELVATELMFADGSAMKNRFFNPTKNPEINATNFSANLPPAYKVVEPMKSK